jgi:hydrogenase nickel incorporation protein HypA/HybF
MHELSLASAIVATAEKHAGGRPVAVVTVRAGALRQVVPSSLEFYFGFVAAGTLCAGARVELLAVPARLRCDGCGAEWELERPPFRCPGCEGSSVTVVGGNELEVESIELEEEACTVPG